jgi:ubiquitin-like modifier-activating enzyme 5
MALKRMGVV